MIIIVSVNTELLPKMLNEIRKTHNAGNWYDFVEIQPENQPLSLSTKFIHLWEDNDHKKAVMERMEKEKEVSLK